MPRAQALKRTDIRPPPLPRTLPRMDQHDKSAPQPSNERPPSQPGTPHVEVVEGARPPGAEKVKGEDKREGEAKPKKKKKLGSRQRGTETVFRTAYRTHLDLSQLADTKANIMISINGLILSIIIAGIGPRIDANPWLLLPVSVLLLVCLASMVLAVLSARPRVSRHAVTLEDVRRDRSNILFFGNFANMDQEEYVEGMEEMLRSGERIYHNMIRDLYGLGGVLLKKYRMLRYAYTVFMIGLVVSVLLFILVFVQASKSV